MENAAVIHFSTSLANKDLDFQASWTNDEEPTYDETSLGQGSMSYLVHTVPVIGERLDSESQRTVITESMSVTASDEEKLQLLNKNTDLRRLNAELMELNQQWDEIYRSTTERLHHTARTLQDEVQLLRQHSDKLSMKLEHEQSKREFYETSLHQEMKRNQKLQEYVRHLEGILHFNTLTQRGAHSAKEMNIHPGPTPSIVPAVMAQPQNCKGCSDHLSEKVEQISKNQQTSQDHKLPSKTFHRHTNKQEIKTVATERDINLLKEQLQALKCQTEIYEADYKTEHTDRERMKTENEKLKKKEKEMREQMLILKEQLKIYEDDFRRERCDKQVLQRLLRSRNTTREPILVHRCNNVTHCKGAFESTGRLSRSGSNKELTERKIEETAQKHCVGF
ncbi:TNFAIP3-interacting protein 1-like [Dendropsophus ebraccatus]|uniref:TNFAIP3-interacting protein 1-like n=1 Tax=Dendropsophus ebraccatus TaxID=150705 RepID=UPI003831C7D2